MKFREFCLRSRFKYKTASYIHEFIKPSNEKKEIDKTQNYLY